MVVDLEPAEQRQQPLLPGLEVVLVELDAAVGADAAGEDPVAVRDRARVAEVRPRARRDERCALARAVAPPPASSSCVSRDGDLRARVAWRGGRRGEDDRDSAARALRASRAGLFTDDSPSTRLGERLWPITGRSPRSCSRVGGAPASLDGPMRRVALPAVLGLAVLPLGCGDDPQPPRNEPEVTLSLSGPADAATSGPTPRRSPAACGPLPRTSRCSAARWRSTGAASAPTWR